MTTRTWLALNLVLAAGLLSIPLLAAQPGPDVKKQPDPKEFGKKDFPFGPGGFGGMKQRRKLIPQFDKDGDGRLNAEERQAAREFLKKDGGKGGFGPGGKGGPGGKKGGFGPGNFLTKPLLEALDQDKDGMLTQAELVTGVKKFFSDTDKDKNGFLDEAQLAEGLNRIIPRPQGFPGGPGGPPDGPKGGPKDGEGAKKGSKDGEGPKKGPKDGEGPKGGFPGGGFFRPGSMLASEIVKRSDVKKNGKVTLDELVMAAEKLFKDLDKDKTGKLDEGAVAAGISQLFPPPTFGPPGGKRDPAKPGPRVTPADVKSYPDAKLYDTTVLRTIFLEFENKDWEAELADFYHTDVEVPATVIVDGKKHANVGVHFRGNTSYMMAPAGYKHSLNLSFDFVNSKQRLYGYKTMNLMNCASDPTFMHSVLFSHIARQYMPAPKANFVKVVINGESWGIYDNVQQFNKEFLKENYKTTNGARWKVPGHPGANAGLNYLGDNSADYKRHYEIRSKDNPKDWKALIELCRILNQTPVDKLEAALKPILNIDGVLWFLAVDNAVINDDGYWTRSSDYNLYRDPKGKFHLIPHDTNETFQPMGFGFGGPNKGGPGGGKGPKGEGGKDPKDGPGGGKGPKDGGFGKGPGGGGYGLDPLVGLNNSRAPLYNRLLAVPSLRAKYLANLRTIANDQFDWKKLKPVLDQYRALIEHEVELDTRKLSSLAEFKSALADTVAEGPGSRYNLRAFADGRRNFLLNHPEIKKVSP